MSVRKQLSKLQPRFRSSRYEKAQLREQLADLLDERDTLTRRFAHEREELEQRGQLLMQENVKLGQWNQSLAHENAELGQTNQSLVLERAQLARQLEEVKAAYTELEGKHDAARREISTLDRSLVDSQTQHEDNVRQFVDEAARLRSDFSEREAALQTELAQAHRAQAYLSTVDSVSHVELQEMVAKLNAQIFQLAALLADVIEIRESDVISAKVIQDSRRSLEAWMGLAMLNHLSRLQSSDEFWVEVGLQAAMTQFAEWRINTWDFDPSRDKGLRAAYDAVFRGEPTAISSRWRTLSRKYAAKLSNTEGSISQAADTLTRLLMQVLWVTRSQITDDSRDWKETIRTKSREIVEQCRYIQTVIAEDVVSCSFEVVGRAKGAVFSDEAMEVDGDDDSGHSGDPVGARILCVTRLGLKGRERVEETPTTEIRTVVLSKATVFLQLDGPNGI